MQHASEAVQSLLAHDADALTQAVLEYTAAHTSSSAERFAEILPRVVARIVGDGVAAQQALEDGGFLLNDATVVMRLNPDTDQIEFFCDIGLPQLHCEAAVYRKLLEINLCRNFPGIVLGVHPESGRVVATAELHSTFVNDDDVCVNILQMLTRLAKRLRDEYDLPLAKEPLVSG